MRHLPLTALGLLAWLGAAVGLGAADLRSFTQAHCIECHGGDATKGGLDLTTLKPDFAALGDLKLGVIGACAAGEDTAFEVRAFVPGLGVPEDPVTGSLNAGLAQWLIGAGLAPPRYVVAQGSALGRAGRVHVAREGDDTWIGGDVVIGIEGEVRL